MSHLDIHRPTAQDIFRYRYQHGVNLGGVFVLEKWLFPCMFDASCSGESELDAVVASINTCGIQKTRTNWENHWHNALTDRDLEWLTKSAHCNCIRLPIGHFTLGPEFCKNTRFAFEPAQIYVNAWTAVENILESCHRYGVGVLIDLHAAPGGANAAAHSGTSSGKAELWKSQDHLELTIQCLEFIARQIKEKYWSETVIGLGIINEAVWDAPGLHMWYQEVKHRISKISPTLPLYVSDAWNLKKTLDFTLQHNSIAAEQGCPLIVDNHQYFTFANHHTKRSPQGLISDIPLLYDRVRELIHESIFDSQTAGCIFVGEYSCVMAESSWKQVPTEQRDDLTRQFGNDQCRKWQEKCSGSAFWTYRMDWKHADGWNFKQQTMSGAILPPRTMTLTSAQVRAFIAKVNEAKSSSLKQEFTSHTRHWNEISPGGGFEHWRYAKGWSLGWTDAKDFFTARIDGVVPRPLTSIPDQTSSFVKTETAQTHFGTDGTVGSIISSTNNLEPVADTWIGGDTIGALDLWVLRRMKEAGIVDREKCPQGWQWEHGFRAAVLKFQQLVMGKL